MTPKQKHTGDNLPLDGEREFYQEHAAELDRLEAGKAELVGILIAVKNCHSGLCSGCRSRISTAIAKHETQPEEEHDE